MFGKLSVMISAVLALGSALPVLYENQIPALISVVPDARGAFVHSVPSILYYSALPLGLQQSASSALSQQNFGQASSFAQNLGSSGLSLSSAQSYNGYAPARLGNVLNQNQGLRPAGAQNSALNQNQSYKLALSNVHNNAVSNAHNNAVGQNQGYVPAIVQNNVLGYQQSQAQAVASQVHNGNKGYESALSRASSNGSDGAAQSVAQNIGGYGSAISASQNQGSNNFGSAISAARSSGGYGSSIAQSAQQNGRHVQQSGASSISAPGFQASQSHAINSGF